MCLGGTIRKKYYRDIYDAALFILCKCCSSMMISSNTNGTSCLINEEIGNDVVHWLKLLFDTSK